MDHNLICAANHRLCANGWIEQPLMLCVVKVQSWLLYVYFIVINYTFNFQGCCNISRILLPNTLDIGSVIFKAAVIFLVYDSYIFRHCHWSDDFKGSWDI